LYGKYEIPYMLRKIIDFPVGSAILAKQQNARVTQGTDFRVLWQSGDKCLL